MHLSCRKDDAGYERYVVLSADNDFKFFVDGTEVDQVITADEEEGFLLTYPRDVGGKIQLGPGRTLVTERRAGVVRIDIMPRRA